MRSFQLVEVNVNRLGLVGVEEEKERVVEGCRQDKRKRGEIWPLWVSAERERERGRNGTWQEGERKEGACEWLRVEEGCWYWLWWRWAGRAEEQGAGWIGRRVSG